MKAVVFDVGHTLVDYKNPLNWSALYSDALEFMFQACGIPVTAGRSEEAKKILTKYNTRVNPREREVGCTQIFQELLAATGDDQALLWKAADSFFDFFHNGAELFEDAESTLAELKNRDIKIGVLTDVAYGMARNRAFGDFSALAPYLDLWYTSADVGFRKPCPVGFARFVREWEIPPDKMLYVGDEEKDIAGANAAGMLSALVCRKGPASNYRQTYTIGKLADVLKLV